MSSTEPNVIDSLSDALNNAMKAADTYDGKEGEFGVSSIGFCLERQILERRHKIKKTDNGDMFMGRAAHSFFLPIVKRCLPPPVEIEVPLRVQRTEGESTAQVFAQVDLVGKDYVVEFKTSNVYTLSEYTLNAYHMQANAYAGLLMEVGRPKIEIVSLVILSKHFTNPNHAVYHVDFSYAPALYEEYWKRIFTILHAVNDNKDIYEPVPPNICKKCEVMHLCPFYKLESKKVIITHEENAKCEKTTQSE